MPLMKRTGPSSDAGTPRRRMIMGIAAIVLLALVGVPGYLASRPGFFSRYPGLSAQYAPWATSTHAQEGCEECHVRPRLLDRSLYRIRMTGEFYVSIFSSARI
ncbi:MAG: hypothetical protein Q7W16_04915, partial [Coriobacteriia bacterium]|nr:hypothetical protein [Coriobacteriia bacterium]